MQAGEGQLHVRLDPHRPDDGRIRRRRDQVLQQRRLSDPGLAPQHQRPTLTAPDRRDQVIQQRALARPTSQAPTRSAETALRRHPRSRRCPQATTMTASAIVPGASKSSPAALSSCFLARAYTPSSDASCGYMVRAAAVIVAMVPLLSAAVSGVLTRGSLHSRCGVSRWSDPTPLRAPRARPRRCWRRAESGRVAPFVRKSNQLYVLITTWLITCYIRVDDGSDQQSVHAERRVAPAGARRARSGARAVPRLGRPSEAR